MTQRYPITPFDQLFDEMFGLHVRGISQPVTFPVHDIYVEDDDLFFQFALSGFKKEDLSVDLASNILTVQGKKETKEEPPTRKYVQKKIAERNFKVSYAVPNDYLGNESEVSFEDGLLTIRFPKIPDARPKRLEIK